MRSRQAGGATFIGRLGLAGCVLGALAGCMPMGPAYRSLHELDGEVVHSPPPPPAAYASYLRARLALEQDPPQIEAAKHHIGQALRSDPRDPHLWATRAEIEERSGEPQRALSSARRALSIRPGYPPAQRMVSRLEREASVTDGGPSEP